jgi:RNA polymerase sigma factor (sigma-70 family)
MASIDDATMPKYLPPETPQYLIKHESFDEYWAKHKALMYWEAKRIARRFNADHREFIGSLILHFNSILYSFDPQKGKLSSYFCRTAYKYLEANFLRRESESWDVHYFAAHTRVEEKRDAHCVYASLERMNYLYHIPEREESWVNEIIDSFDTLDKCWRFLTRGVKPRDLFVLEKYYRDGWTLDHIGGTLQVTKERVRQIRERALRAIRDRLSVVESFAQLFSHREE